MGLIRFLTIAAILYLLYTVSKHFVRRGHWPVKRHKNTAKSDDSKQRDNEVMVACQYCDVRVPKTQAIEHNNQWFCCQEHAQANDQTKNR